MCHKLIHMHKPSALTIGIFDGVHLGHRELLKSITTQAEALGLVPTLMTFDPHPAKILSPGGIENIFTLEDRVKVAKSLGIKNVVVIPFTKALSALSAEEFFKNYIMKEAKGGLVKVGYDFTFGNGRKGTTEILKNLCVENNIQFEVLPPHKQNGQIISSSLIRNLVKTGDVASAGEFLNRPFYLQGKIVKGEGRGRTIGIPTANLETKSELYPNTGVYVTGVEYDGDMLRSVTNIGYNPTFENSGGIKIESHILDFSKDIYDSEIKIHFFKRLREEKKFSKVKDLVTQVKLDIKDARDFKWPKK